MPIDVVRCDLLLLVVRLRYHLSTTRWLRSWSIRILHGHGSLCRSNSKHLQRYKHKVVELVGIRWRLDRTRSDFGLHCRLFGFPTENVDDRSLGQQHFLVAKRLLVVRLVVHYLVEFGTEMFVSLCV